MANVTGAKKPPLMEMYESQPLCGSNEGHAAIDGSLLGTAGQWGAWGWSRWSPCTGCMARWKQDGLLVICKKLLGKSGSMLTTSELSMDYEKEKVSVKSQGREVLIYGCKFWEELHGLAERGILVEVEHVMAHRTKKRTCVAV